MDSFFWPTCGINSFAESECANVGSWVVVSGLGSGWVIEILGWVILVCFRLLIVQ